MGNESLKVKTAKSVAWTSLQRFMNIGIRFVSGIILARLLTAEDYGCIGMLSIFILISESILDGGFGSALIQKKSPTREDYSTIFFWNMGMSLTLYAILFLAAPFIADFYNMPLLCDVLRVQGVVLIINAFAFVQSNQLRKQFRFKKIAIVSLITTFVSLSITIFMAYKGFGVWALVTNYLVTAFIPAVVYWLTNKWYPMLVFSKKSFKELFSFGFYIFLSNIINNASNNVQGLLIGKFYSASTMGYYSKANSTEALASTSISSVLGIVSYPLYSEAQNDLKALANIIKKLTSSVSFITFPLLFLLISIAKPLFVLLYSDRWLQSVPYFQILCLAGLAICLQSLNSMSISAIGKSKVMFKWTFVKRGIGLLLIFLGIVFFGIKGLLIAMVLQSWVIYIINAWLVSKYIGYKLLSQLKDLLPIILLSLVAFAVAFSIGYFLDAHMYIVGAIQAISFIGVYWGGAYLCRLSAYAYFKTIIPIFTEKFKKKHNKQ